MKVHLFDSETPRYVTWMNRVDDLTETQAKNELKWVLDALFGEGEGIAGDPRFVSHDLRESHSQDIMERLEDLLPAGYEKDDPCSECGVAIHHHPGCEENS